MGLASVMDYTFFTYTHPISLLITYRIYYQTAGLRNPTHRFPALLRASPQAELTLVKLCNNTKQINLSLQLFESA